MKSGIVETALSIILVVLLLVVAPAYYIGIIEWGRAQSEAQSDVRNLVDEIIDTRVLTKDMLADFNLALAAKSNYMRATITREVKVINPDPVNVGETYTTYMTSDKLNHWNQGDLVTVRVETIGMNFFMSIARSMFGLDMTDDVIQFTGRVR